MRRFPVATLVAVLSLAAGIGATMVTLMVRNAVFRWPRPLYEDPGPGITPGALEAQLRAT